MDPRAEHALLESRRLFVGRGATGAGLAALAHLFCREAAARPDTVGPPGAIVPHFPPKARRVIYLFQSGAPSQLDLYDPKPGLADRFNSELPGSVRMGQRLTGMTSGQAAFPVAPSMFRFHRCGESGLELSELLPHLGTVADDIALVRTLHTEAINHDPAITFAQTGFQQAGRPSVGAWVTYGLGSETDDLPSFVVLTSRGSGRPDDQPLYDRLWGSGFLPSRFQGVKFRGVGDPILYLSNPPGVDATLRRRVLDGLAQLNQQKLADTGDPEVATRIAQYEMAFRMQSSAPELMNFGAESQRTLDLYGPDVTRPGSYAANCLLARRLAERGVRFIQLFHMGWDQHGALPQQIRGQCRDTDQPTAALLKDLKARGLLDDTLVVWAGEFGRTVYCQGPLARDNYGRDHHPRCFSAWMAGGGIKGGVAHGQTDDFSYNIVNDPVHVHDWNATILHCLGVDHTRLTYRYQGRDFRLTDVHGEVVRPILA